MAAPGEKLGGLVEKAGDVYWRFGDPLVHWCGDNLTLLVAAAVGIVVLWEIPLLILRSQARLGVAGTFHAIPGVRRWGLPAYILFLVRRRGGSTGVVRTAGASKSILPVRVTRMALASGPLARLKSLLPGKRTSSQTEKDAGVLCPHCYRPADQYADYQPDLDFSKCPHCGDRISPRLYYGAHIEQLIATLAKAAERSSRSRRRKNDLTTSENMAALVRAIFDMACALRATDVHLERKQKGAVVQMRIDGVLSEAFRAPATLAPHLLSALKVQAKLDITNHTSPQDGRFGVRVGVTDLDVRVHGAPTSGQGEILFLRLLNERSIQLSPEKIGLEDGALRHFREAIERPHGLILVTGPTGSGKSTTLYVALRAISTGERNILTVEDPVEYQLPGLKQMQVKPGSDFGFANGLRSVLRQDPDVIMVGEIRDRETAVMATEAAGTGHLVFSTLHTMDVATTPARLADLGVSPSRYAPALELIVAQRLVRLICSECREPYRPTPEEAERLGLETPEDTRVWKPDAGPAADPEAPTEFFAGAGCPACESKGYLGRAGVFELFRPDAEMRTFLEQETLASEFTRRARQKGMRTLREEALRCARAGRTSIEEILRVTA